MLPRPLLNSDYHSVYPIEEQLTLVHRLSSPEAAVFHQLEDDLRFPGSGRSGDDDSAVGRKVRREVIGDFPEQPLAADERLRAADHRLRVGHFEEERLQGPVGLPETYRSVEI